MFKYVKLSDMLRDIIDHKKQLKTVLYNQTSQTKSLSVSASYSLLSSIINNYALFDHSVDSIESVTRSSINNRYLVMVMMAELINTGKIVGGGKLKKLIMSNQSLLPQITKDSKINKQMVQLRIRINDQQSQQIKKMVVDQYDGRQDQTITNLFHLNQQNYSKLTKDTNLNLLQLSTCIMQSFSSALPPFLLMSGVDHKYKCKSFDVIDTCSAPGNKTIQLAEYLSEKGTVYAFQKNDKRYSMLCQTIEKYKVKNIIASLGDFLNTKPRQYKSVKFVLVDPSCSGSGMLTNFQRDGSLIQGNTQTFEEFCLRKQRQLDTRQAERVKSLQSFQISVLNHAAKFKPKRISYSTCSIYKAQNEDVVRQFLITNPRYRIKKNKIGKNENVLTGFGHDFRYCVRVDPRNLKTDGFFVCIFTLKCKDNIYHSK